MKLTFSGQIFEECSYIKFHENPSSESRVVPCGRAGRRGEADSRFSQFCEGANAGGILVCNSLDGGLQHWVMVSNPDDGIISCLFYCMLY